jgi:hypothetical protein
VKSNTYKHDSGQYNFDKATRELAAEFDSKLRHGLFKNGVPDMVKLLLKDTNNRINWPKPEKRCSGAVLRPATTPSADVTISSASSSSSDPPSASIVPCNTTSSTDQFPTVIEDFTSIDQANSSISTFKTANMEEYRKHIKSAMLVYPLLHWFQNEVEFIRWERYKAAQAALERLVSMFVGNLAKEGYEIVIVLGATKFGKQMKGNLHIVFLKFFGDF